MVVVCRDMTLRYRQESSKERWMLQSRAEVASDFRMAFQGQDVAWSYEVSWSIDIEDC